MNVVFSVDFSFWIQITDRSADKAEALLNVFLVLDAH